MAEEPKRWRWTQATGLREDRTDDGDSLEARVARLEAVIETLTKTPPVREAKAAASNS